MQFLTKIGFWFKKQMVGCGLKVGLLIWDQDIQVGSNPTTPIICWRSSMVQSPELIPRFVSVQVRPPVSYARLSQLADEIGSNPIVSEFESRRLEETPTVAQPVERRKNTTNVSRFFGAFVQLVGHDPCKVETSDRSR